jgi:RNA polymerase sigma factor (sigma-70 family)
MSVNFATYARYRITGALRDFRRWRFGEGRRGEKTCRPMILSIGDGLESYGNALGVKSQWPVGAEFEAADTVEQWLRRLPERQAEICRLIYLDGMSQDEVADLLGRSRSSISRQHQEALARLTGQVEQFQTAGGSTAFDWTTS